MSLTKFSDMIYVVRIIKILTTPWDKQPAFKKGLIDGEGNLLKEYSEMTSDEKEVYSYFHRFVFNLKRLLSKISKATITDVLASFALLKENTSELNIEDESWLLVEDVILQTFMAESFLNEDEPTNNTGSAVCTDVPTGGPIVRRSYKGVPEFRGAKVFEVDHHQYHALKFGKANSERWNKYFEEGTEPGDTIKAYSRSNPGKPIIVQCGRTKSMQFLKGLN